MRRRLRGEGTAETQNLEAGGADEGVKDADQRGGRCKGDVDPAADELAAGLDEGAAGEEIGRAAGVWIRRP